jgi:hypothetical protein
MNRPRYESGAGFTLAESLLAAVILMAAISAIVLPFAVGARNEQVDARMCLAINLAQEMMEEILSKPFNDPQGTVSLPGPEPGETRRDKYDNIDDYHGYVEPVRKIADATGAYINVPASEGLSRSVTAQYVYVSGQDVAQPATFIRVTVTVNFRDVPLITLARLVYKIP